MDALARRIAVVQHQREVLLARYSIAMARWQAVQGAAMAGLALALVGYFQGLLNLRSLGGVALATLPYLFVAWRQIESHERRFESEAAMLHGELLEAP